VAFNADGSLLASAGGSAVKLWRMDCDPEGLTLDGPSGPVWALAFRPDGGAIAAGTDDAKVTLWDARTGARTGAWPGPGRAVEALTFAADGSRLAAAGSAGSLVVWDSRSGRELQRVDQFEGQPLGAHITFRADLKRVAAVTGADLDMIRVWDGVSDRGLRLLMGHRGMITALAFSPDGCTLASAAQDGRLILWDAATGAQQVSFDSRSQSVRCLVFSPNGHYLAVGAEEAVIRVWDLESGRVRTLHGHGAGVRSLAFSPDGRRLASGGDDRTVRIWDWDAKLELLKLWGHVHRVLCVRFSPDGRQLAAAGEDGTIHLWSGRD
jgi:WD40 repeat protein